VQAGLLNVASEQPGDWRDVTVPWPFGILRVAVLARSLDDTQGFRVDLRPSEKGLAGSGNSRWPERMNQRTTYRDDGGYPHCEENPF